MKPRLKSGCFGLFRNEKYLNEGDTVLVDHPQYGRIVKSILQINGGEIWLTGLSLQSTPACDLGAVPTDAVLGKLVWSVQPPN